MKVNNLAIVLCLVFAEPLLAKDNGAFIGSDLGGSFSPHGVGVTIGYKLENSAYFGIGSGYSKKLKLGWPISLETGFKIVDLPVDDSANPAEINVVGGVSYYSGQGEQSVVHQSETVGITGQVEWQLVYARMGFDISTKTKVQGLSYFVEPGFAFNLYSKISSKDKFDATNLGEPVAIDVDSIPGTHAGPNDRGLYFRLGLRWFI